MRTNSRSPRIPVLAGALALTIGLPLAGGEIFSSDATAASDKFVTGVFSEGSRAPVTQWGEWVGRDVGVTTVFMPNATWNDISNWKWGVGLYKERYHRVAWAVPMLPDDPSTTIQQGAKGAYNDHYRKLAEMLVANNQGDSIIRIGWEFNTDSYRWTAKKDPAAWTAYWRQIVKTMRSVPGAKFEFNWSPASGNNLGQFHPERAYPGDEYVDIVGQSLYDHSQSFRPEQSVERWANMYNQPGGLKWLAEFGEKHSKPLAFSEWGLTDSCDGWDSGDDTYFIQQLHDYIANHNVAYESYFNHDPSNCEQHKLNTGDFPKAASLYRVLWQEGFAPVPSPSSTGTSATSDTLVRFRSQEPTSSPSYDLEGAHLYGPAYIDVNVPSRTTRSVSFYLDKAPTGTATKTEATAPYDLGGASPISPTALPVDTDKWAPGQHSLTVVVSRYNLPTLTQTVTFNVGATESLRVSTRSDRSRSVPLSDANLAGAAYVFADTPGAKKVEFFLDTSTHTKAFSTEGDAPYDLSGTNGSLAKALDVSTLSPGGHTLTARVTYPDGSKKVLRSSFLTR